MTEPDREGMDRLGAMLDQHNAGTLEPICECGYEYQEEPDVREYPGSLAAARDLLADVSTAALALVNIIDKGEQLHDEGDFPDSYVDQAARPVVLELRDALSRWGE